VVAGPAAPARARVLIADDQAGRASEALRLLLKARAIRRNDASTPAAVVEAVQATEFDVILMELNYQRDTTSGQKAWSFCRGIQSLDSKLR